MAKRKSAKAKTTNTSRKSEVILWCVLAVAILLFLSNFGLIGTVGDVVSKVCFGIFGVLAYVFPILFFLAVAFAISNAGEHAATVKLVSAGLFILFLDGLFEVIRRLSQGNPDYTPWHAFLDGYINKAGGGFLGGIVTVIFCNTIRPLGTIIVCLIALIISLVLFTGRSALGGIKRGSKKVYDKASEDAAYYRALREQSAKARAEEKKQLRREKIAQAGVPKNTKLKQPEDDRISDEIEELSEDTEAPAVGLRKRAAVRPLGAESADLPEQAAEEPVKSDALRELIIHNANEEPEEEEEEPVLSDFSEEISALVRKEAPEPKEPIEQVSSAVPVEEPVAPEPAAPAVPVSEPKRTKANKPGAVESAAAVSSVAQEIDHGAEKKKRPYIFPPIELLSKADKNKRGDTEDYLRETAAKLAQVLETFGVRATVTDVSCGPAVTRYELEPGSGVKVSKIVSLADDIKLNLAAADIRIEAPIPGKAAVGIEVPNKEAVPVMFRELVDSAEFKKEKSRIAFGAGKDIAGKVIVADIAKMPHVLIAGATGSGKSVCINTIIMSILYRADPEDVKLIMIDPKVVELSVYNGIPHLLIPVVTDPKKAAGALNWAVQEMTDRYQKFAQYQVRKIEEYNAKVENIKDIEDENKPQKMPQIVVIVDELADLMMVAPGDVEDAICRLAQLARACGIHLVIATQRPSVNVITGLIKANMPSRVAFAVTSGVDSRTILDMVGAEKLLGKGDMLFYPQGLPKPLRVQGAFVSDKEVADVVSFIKEQNGETVYDDTVVDQVASAATSGGSGNGASLLDGNGADGRDEYFVDAGKLIIDKDKASIGMLQRFFKIGFNRAARIMDQLEEAGVVGPEAGTKAREILMSEEQFENFLEQEG